MPYDVKDYPFRGGGHFYLFPKFAAYEEMGIVAVDNPQLGRLYKVQTTEGGPYLEMSFFRRPGSNVYEGTVTVRRSFWLKGNLVVRPDTDLTTAFEEIRAFVRRETPVSDNGSERRTSGGS